MTTMEICGTILSNGGSYMTNAICNFIYHEMKEKHGESVAREMAKIYATTRYCDDANTFEEYKRTLEYIDKEIGK